jgi:hypothetical protein
MSKRRLSARQRPVVFTSQGFVERHSPSESPHR